MIATSQAYKDAVYSQELARRFLPEVLLQVIDVTARNAAVYSSSSAAFYSDFSQLTDENLEGRFDYGTLEDYQFLLDGTKRLMPSRNTLLQRQYGWVLETMSGEDGVFGVPQWLQVDYPQGGIHAVGRELHFDATYDSVPADFDVEYYLRGTLVGMLPVRQNESYVFRSTVSIELYDRVVFRFLSTSKPYRRIHIVEDIPGIYMQYDESNVVSMTHNQIIDLLSQELVTGEMELEIENADKSLNILNDEGFEAYLQQRQPISAKLRMVYPDGTEEPVSLGVLQLTNWKAPKGTIVARFTARDFVDNLSLSDYIKGTFSSVPRSLEELAIDVLEDSGVTSYTIDIQLRNIYTTAPLPIATHKELLRLIAQAGMSVVVPQLDGGIHIKYVSPLVSCSNLISNPCFDSNWTGWDSRASATLTNQYIYQGSYSAKLATGGYLQQTISFSNTAQVQHRFYFRLYVTRDSTVNSGTDFYLKINGEPVTVDMSAVNIQEGEFTAFSGYYIAEGTATSLTWRLENNASAKLVGCFMAIDLTSTYQGNANIPFVGQEDEVIKGLAWCDKNYRFFTTQLLVPRAQDPYTEYANKPAAQREFWYDESGTAFDYRTLGYNILEESPEISTSDPVKAVEANIYSYKTSADTSEIFKGIRIITGTEEFDIRFNTLAKNCTIEVWSLDSSGERTSANTAELLSQSIYAQAATIKVKANCTVEIKVTGNSVTAETTQFKVDQEVYNSLVAQAVTKSIDNKLITNKTVAEDVVDYAVYWYMRRYEYTFDWRQNPAVEILDQLVVHDDFDKDNAVFIVQRNLVYEEGYLHGDSKGVT